MKLAGVVFDVNETLVDLGGLDPVFARFDLPSQARLLWLAQTLRDGFALGAAGRFVSFAEVAVETADQMCAGLGAEILLTFPSLQLHSDVVESLQTLAAAGIPMVTLTVGDPQVTKAIMDECGAGGLITAYLSCTDVQRWKPAPEPYLHASAALNGPAQDVVMVASHSWDLAGAHAVGMRTAWIARGEAAPASWLDESTPAFANLRDCAAYLVQ